MIQAARLTNDPRAAAAELVRDTLTIDQALDSPFLMFGSVNQIRDRIIELRERFGTSYLTAFDARSGGFGQVVSRLFDQ